MGKAIFVFAACTVALILIGLIGPDGSAGSSARIGDVVLLQWRPGDTSPVLGANNKAAFNELTEAVAAKDRIGYFSLVESGRVIPLVGGTAARILDKTFSMTRVRVLDGLYFGRAVWVCKEVAEEKAVWPPQKKPRGQ